MLETFYSSLVLPVSQQTLQLKQMPSSAFMQLQKYLIEDNNELIAEYFEYIIHACCKDECNIQTLTCIDKLACLLKIRSISCGDSVIFTNANQMQGVISMNYVLQKLYNIDFNISREIQVDKHISIEVDIPHTLSKGSIHEVFQHLIKCINTVDAKIYSHQITKQQLAECMRYLNATATTHMSKFLSDNQKLEIIAFEGNESLELKDITLNPFNDSIIEFCKFIFKGDLLNEYKSIYTICSKAHISPEYLLGIAPVEQQLYLRFLLDETEQNNKQLNEANKHLNTQQ